MLAFISIRATKFVTKCVASNRNATFAQKCQLEQMQGEGKTLSKMDGSRKKLEIYLFAKIWYLQKKPALPQKYPFMIH